MDFSNPSITIYCDETGTAIFEVREKSLVFTLQGLLDLDTVHHYKVTTRLMEERSSCEA